MNTGIDPRIGGWFNFLVLVLGLVVGGQLYFGHLSADTVTDIKGYAGDAIAFIGAANLVFHLYDAQSPVRKGLSRMIAPSR